MGNWKVRYFVIFALLILIPNQSMVFAQNDSSYKFTKFDGDEIKNNPVAQQMLQKIEESKKILAELEAGIVKPKMTEHQKFIEDQRKTANAKLEQDLSAMNKEYEIYTPRNAYGTFLTGINSTYHGIFWGQFNYMDQKVQIAKAARDSILARGGTYQEAFDTFSKFASITKSEMIKINQELNVNNGFTDAELQSYFDENGKLPRYEDDDMIPCYSCQRYEVIATKIIAESIQTKS